MSPRGLESCTAGARPAARRTGARHSGLGGKAQGLLRLQAAGCRIPRFRVIDASCFSSALGKAAPRLHALLLACGNACETAAAIDRLLTAPDVAARLRLAVERALPGRLSSRRRYAVRSSALGEDAQQASFAGLLATRLNVPAEQVTESVVTVWRSAFSARVLAYRSRRGLPTSALASAVIVQEMVAAEAAGVLFTRAPEHADECMVCAGYGLGEGVVADRVAVDTYRIERRSGSIRREIVAKDTRIAAASGGGTQIEPIAQAARSAAALSDRTLRELCRLGLRLEARFATALDIEFAVDRRRRIHILQARPITVAARGVGALRIWDNANIVESYPGLTLPLTFSFAQVGYAAAFRAYMRRRTLDFFPFRSPLRERAALFDNLIGLMSGRVYYNLLSWYEMMSVLPGFACVRVGWDRMIGTAGTATAREHRLRWLPRMFAWGYCLWKLLFPRGTVRRFTRRFEPVYARFAACDFSALDADELVGEYEALRAALAEDWSLTLDNDFAAMAYFEVLTRLCRRWGGAHGEALANGLLRHAPDMESVRPVRALEELLRLVRQDAHLAALFGLADADEILARLQADPGHGGFVAALRAYLDRWGDRCLEELKLEQESFRERPALLIGTLRSMLLSPRTPSDAARAAPHSELSVQLTHPLRRAVLAFVLRRARFGIASRENMRFARARVFGVARRIFRELGARFCEQGVLERASDIHYLTVDEVIACVRGTRVTAEPAALVTLRRTEYAGFAARQMPNRFCTRGVAAHPAPEPPAQSAAEAGSARGTPCAPGLARAAARIVRDPRAAAPEGRHVLVSESTDPGWVFLMTRAEALIVERGSLLSHSAIIGRELGIPTVVGVCDATRRIPDGADLSIDGTTGIIQWR